MSEIEKPTLDLAAIRARCEAAVPGPWSFKDDDEPQIAAPDPRFPDGGFIALALDRQQERDATVDFVIAARSDIPALLTLVDTLTQALLAVEWRVHTSGVYLRRCSACGGEATQDPHVTDCIVDVALTAAGYPDAASRDAARARMKETP